jgi:hypothetical protein
MRGFLSVIELKTLPRVTDIPTVAIAVLAMVLKVSGYEGESEDAEGMNAVGVVNETPQIRLALSCPKIRA